MNHAISPSITSTGPTAQLRTTLVAAVVVSAVLAAVCYYGVIGVTDDSPLLAVAIASAVSVVTAAILWWANRAAFAAAEVSTRRTIVLAVLAVVSIGGVWFGITAPVAATAALFGRKATAAGRTRLGSVTTSIAVLVLVATVVLNLLGES
ncbi:MAG TPA: hypothetical protein VFI19_07430 [Nocardioides sp.]|nr:hypothetical protein [Nocardioides sp.]